MAHVYSSNLSDILEMHFMQLILMKLFLNELFSKNPEVIF